jgi:DNA-directed RNA polymerase subunit H (RpoH/RPB5)
MEHPGFAVYTHLPRYLEGRGFALPDAAPLPRDRFVAELNHIGYFQMATADRSMVVLLLAAGGKYANHGPQLRNLLMSITAARAREVLVVVPPGVMGKKNMTDVVAKYREVSDIRYDMQPYSVFVVDIPRVQCIPRHEIVPPDEVAAFLEGERLAAGDLKTMLATDPPVVWIGGRPGQIVRTTAPSETAGEVIDYWRLI